MPVAGVVFRRVWYHPGKANGARLTIGELKPADPYFASEGAACTLRFPPTLFQQYTAARCVDTHIISIEIRPVDIAFCRPGIGKRGLMQRIAARIDDHLIVQGIDDHAVGFVKSKIRTHHHQTVAYLTCRPLRVIEVIPGQDLLGFVRVEVDLYALS